MLESKANLFFEAVLEKTLLTDIRASQTKLNYCSRSGPGHSGSTFWPKLSPAHS